MGSALYIHQARTKGYWRSFPFQVEGDYLWIIPLGGGGLMPLLILTETAKGNSRKEVQKRNASNIQIRSFGIWFQFPQEPSSFCQVQAFLLLFGRTTPICTMGTKNLTRKASWECRCRVAMTVNLDPLGMQGCECWKTDKTQGFHSMLMQYWVQVLKMLL